MDIKEKWRMNRYKIMVNRIKANLDYIEIGEAPIYNRDMLKLFELFNAKSKSEAIQSAVRFALDNYELKYTPLSSAEEKLEKLRYAKQEVHEASDDLLDSEDVYE